MEKRLLHAETGDRSVNDDYQKFTVDDILNFIGYGPLQVIAFFLAGLTTLSFGFEAVVFAFIELPVQQKWNLTDVEYAILPSATGVFNIIGGVLYGYLGDHYGRVWPNALSLLNVGVASLASAFSPNFPTLVVLRCLASVGVTGAAIMVFPTLIEFLPVRNRGKVSILVVVIQTIGSCSGAGLAWWLVPTYKDDGWRYFIVALSIPILFAAVYRIVFRLQSPRFLLAKKRFKEAWKVLSLMATINRKQLGDLIPEDAEFEEIILLEAQANQSFWQTIRNFRTLFTSTYLRRTILIGLIFAIANSSYYGSTMFLPSVLNDLTHKPYFNAFVGFLGPIPGVLLMSIIVEWRHVGRLNSLRFFSLLTVMSFLLFAFIQTEVTIPVFTILIYFSAAPMITLLYIYISECYPTSIRIFAISFFNNISAIAVTFIPFLSGYVSTVSIPWLYPVVWAGLYGFQFLLALFLNFETLGIELIDTVL